MLVKVPRDELNAAIEHQAKNMKRLTFYFSKATTCFKTKSCLIIRLEYFDTFTKFSEMEF